MSMMATTMMATTMMASYHEDLLGDYPTMLNELKLLDCWTRTKLSDRAFSVAGPVVWNSLPTAVREADSLYSFKRKLKTHLFTMCFTD